MKKLVTWILAFTLIMGVGMPTVVYGEDEDIEIIEENLTEEELELLREEERQRLWEAAVEKESDKSLKELSTSYLIGDFETGEILEEHNIDDFIAIASTSKILTVYVVLDEISNGKLYLDDTVEIDKGIAMTGGASYDLKEGETPTIEDLIKAAMVVSGNDSVKALAKAVAGSEEDFVLMMKNKLNELGIAEYNIINASGLPDYSLPDHRNQNMMTTRGLFELSRSILDAHPEILNYTTIEEIIEPQREYKNENTNPILGEVRGIDGLKTGYTGAAGRCMVATGISPGVEDKRDEMRIIGITMGSKNDAQRYVAIKKLMKKGLYEYEKRVLTVPEYPVETINNPLTVPENIPLYSISRDTLLLHVDDKVNYTTTINPIEPPMDPLDEVGYITYYVNGEESYSSPLIIRDKIRDPTWAGWVMRFYEEAFSSANRLFRSEI